MPNQFGSDQPERICTKKVTYDLQFKKAYPGSDPQPAALGLVQLTGSITEKYECMNPTQLQLFRIEKNANGGKLFGNNWGGTSQNPPSVSLTCNPENPVDGLFNQVLQVIHQRQQQGSLKDIICNNSQPGRGLYDLRFNGSCYYELDECNPTEIPENTEVGAIVNPPDRQREQCWYEGDATIDTFNGLVMPHDSILGYIPEDLCSLPDDYQSQCNLHEIFLEKLGNAQISASIGSVIESAIFAVATGGSFSVFDVLGVIDKIQNPRVRNAMNTILRIYSEALTEYLDCLKSELGL